MADETCRSEFRVAFDELEADAEFVGDGPQQRGLAGARRPFQQHVTVGGQGRDDEIDLTSPPDDLGRQTADEFVMVHSMISRQSNRMTPRMFSPLRIAS